MTSSPEPEFRLRSVALAAFLPTLLFSIGEGAMIPLIPVVADDLGATLAIAGFVASMILVGELFGDIPSGWVVARVGERNAMLGASVLAVLGLAVCLAAPNPVVLAVGVFVVGLATAVFALARHAFMTTYVPIAVRARMLSTLGGVFRAGWFIGPFLSAGVIALTGSTTSGFWLFAGFCGAAALVLLLLPDPERTFGSRRRHTTLREGERLVADEAAGLFRTIWLFRGALVRMGSGAALIGALRASRMVLLPLWAVSIGVDETATALIIGIAGAVDFALFYTSGQIMDRFGRLWSAVPSMVGLGVGHLALSFTHDVDGRVTWFVAIAMLLAVANGVGSGILMTLGADLAPRDRPAPFLGAWRFTSDAGGAAAPLAVSTLTAVASLSLAAGVMGILGLIGAVILAVNVPRYVPRSR